jgi:cytochrome c oxidase cbb3-type subunit IV
MFNFIKRYAERMLDIDLYPLISLLIFFFFFVILTIYVIRMKKSSVNEASQIPLND